MINHNYNTSSDIRNVKCENPLHVQSNVTIANNCYYFSGNLTTNIYCILSNLDIILFNLKIHRKLTYGSSFRNVGEYKTKIYLKSLRRISCKSHILKITNKGKPRLMIFSLTCSLLKMDTYSNDFQNIFLAMNPCDCNQIRSNQTAPSLTALNHFHF